MQLCGASCLIFLFSFLNAGVCLDLMMEEEGLINQKTFKLAINIIKIHHMKNGLPFGLHDP